MIGADEIRLMSDALAADPGSLVFLQLGEALRRLGQLDLALRVAQRGVDRHPQRADAHDLLARVAADRGDAEKARVEWEKALQLAPGHPAAQKGLGYLYYQQGAYGEAESLLAAAAGADPSDPTLVAALGKIRAAEAVPRATAITAARPSISLNAVDEGGATGAAGAAIAAAGAPARPPRATQALAAPAPFGPPTVDARDVFASVVQGDAQAALLLDADGLVVAGQYRAADGRDLGADVGAQLSGVSDEAARAMRHLGVGAWTHIAIEAETASVAMAPSGDGVLLVAAPRGVPLGFVRRILDRSLDRARKWMESGT